MKEKRFNTQSGISIIEALIVLVILAIVVAFAVAQIGQSKNTLQRQNIARQLKVSLERARFDSVKRRAANAADMARVTIDSATSFTLYTDVNQNGTIDASDGRQFSFGNGDIRLVGINSFPVTVSFDQRGQVILTNGSPNFTICNGCTADTATAQNSSIVRVSPTGTVSMTAGGDSAPNFLNPAVANVSASEEIKSSVAVATNVNGATSSTPTSTATPTPSASPTPTPNASPTPTPTPVPTPTPTPTPKACLTNQRPTQDNCVCKSPMFVRSNGKCQ